MRRFAPIAVAALLSLPMPCLGLTLRYAAPSRCPPESTLRASIVEGLGRRMSDGPETVTVQVGADRRSARVSLLDADGVRLGQRIVRSATGDCDALVRAAGLSAGLALGPLRVTSKPRPSVDTTARATRPESTPPAPDPEAPDDIELGLGLGASLVAGLHPGLAVQVSGGLVVRRGSWVGSAEVWASGAPAWLDGAAAGGRVRSGAFGGAIWGCGGGRGLSGCIGALGAIEAHAGLDFAQASSTSGPWIAGGLRVEWRVWAERWGPRLDVLIPVSRLTLTVDEASIWTTPAVAGALGIGGRL